MRKIDEAIERHAGEGPGALPQGEKEPGAGVGASKGRLPLILSLSRHLRLALEREPEAEVVGSGAHDAAGKATSPSPPGRGARGEGGSSPSPPGRGARGEGGSSPSPPGRGVRGEGGSSPSPPGRGVRGEGESSPSPPGRGVRGEGESSPSPPGRGARGEGKRPPETQIKPPLPPELLRRCRELRRRATSAERLLWRLLRNRQLGGAKFRRQHPLAGFILDFYCHQARLAIEVDGGGHAEPEQARYDAERTQTLAEAGVRVLRFWNHEVLQNTAGVLEAIWMELPAATSEGEPVAMIDTFETDRMTAERLEPGHLDELYPMYRDPVVMASLGGLRSEEHIRENLAWNLAHWERHGFGLWVFRDRATGRFIGRAGLRHTQVAGRDEVELAYALLAAFWGQGLATEMARAVVRVGFEVLGLADVVCFTTTTNRASQRVMEKAGFVYEGDIVRADLPHVLYRLTAPTAPGCGQA